MKVRILRRIYKFYLSVSVQCSELPNSKDQKRAKYKAELSGQVRLRRGQNETRKQNAVKTATHEKCCCRVAVDGHCAAFSTFTAMQLRRQLGQEEWEQSHLSLLLCTGRGTRGGIPPPAVFPLPPRARSGIWRTPPSQTYPHLARMPPGLSGPLSLHQRAWPCGSLGRSVADGEGSSGMRRGGRARR